MSLFPLKFWNHRTTYGTQLFNDLQDCSLLGGRDCDAGTAFLQTKSAYRSLGATDMAPSFFQTAEEARQASWCFF